LLEVQHGQKKGRPESRVSTPPFANWLLVKLPPTPCCLTHRERKFLLRILLSVIYHFFYVCRSLRDYGAHMPGKETEVQFLMRGYHEMKWDPDPPMTTTCLGIAGGMGDRVCAWE
jgi:hypothetical protein